MWQTGSVFDKFDQLDDLVVANVYEPAALEAANEAAAGESTDEEEVAVEGEEEQTEEKEEGEAQK